MDMQLRKSNDFRRSASTLMGGFERTGRTQSVLRNQIITSATELIIGLAISHEFTMNILPKKLRKPFETSEVFQLKTLAKAFMAVSTALSSTQ